MGSKPQEGCLTFLTTLLCLALQQAPELCRLCYSSSILCSSQPSFASGLVPSALGQWLTEEQQTFPAQSFLVHPCFSVWNTCTQRCRTRDGPLIFLSWALLWVSCQLWRRRLAPWLPLLSGTGTGMWLWQRGPKVHCCQLRWGPELGTCVLSAGRYAGLWRNHGKGGC